MALEPIDKTQPEPTSFAAPPMAAPELNAPPKPPTAGSELLNQPAAPNVAFADTLDLSASLKAPAPAQAAPMPQPAQPAPRSGATTFAPDPALGRPQPTPMQLSGTVLAVTPAQDPSNYSLSDRLVSLTPASAAPAPTSQASAPNATMGLDPKLRDLQTKRSMELLGAWNPDAQVAGANFLNQLNGAQFTAMYSVLDSYSKGALQLDPKSTRQQAINESITAASKATPGKDPTAHIKNAVARADLDYVEFVPAPPKAATAGTSLAAASTLAPDPNAKMAPAVGPNAQAVPTAAKTSATVAQTPSSPLLDLGLVASAALPALTIDAPQPLPSTPSGPQTKIPGVQAAANLKNETMVPPTSAPTIPSAAPQQAATFVPAAPATGTPQKSNDSFLGLGAIAGAPTTAFNNGQPSAPAPGAPASQAQMASNAPGTPAPQGAGPNAPTPGVNAQPNASPGQNSNMSVANNAEAQQPPDKYHVVTTSRAADGGSHIRMDLTRPDGGITVVEEHVGAPLVGGPKPAHDAGSTSSMTAANAGPPIPTKGFSNASFRSSPGLVPDIAMASADGPKPSGAKPNIAGTIGDAPVTRAGVTRALTPAATI